jgi:hypothetical protein
MRSGRPLPGEFASYAAEDIAHVVGDDALTALATQRERVLALLSPLDDQAVDGVTYAPGKWTLKDVLAHLADDERVFSYRLLCLARRDARVLDGFDEREYAEAAPAAWEHRGMANGYEASVRGLAFHIAGHELRHLRAIESLYLPRLRHTAHGDR